MKKVSIFLVLITAYTFAFGQKTLVAPGTKTVTVETDTAYVDSIQSVQEFLIQFSAWKATCGDEGLMLIEQGRKMGLNVVQEFKDLPTPTTQEGVKQWVDKIDILFGGLGSIVTMLLTFALSLFKKDPAGAVTKVQAVFNAIRTRYLLAISAVVVSGVGVLYFNEGPIGFVDILSGIGVALGVAIGAIGVKGLLEMFKINLTAKK
jgi:hypothetical protein